MIYDFYSRARQVKLLLPVLNLLFCTIVFCQPSDPIDSLNQVIRTTKSDTIKARCYISLASLYYPSKPDTLIPICNAAVQFINKKLPGANTAERKSLLLSKSAALTNIGIIYSQFGDMDKAVTYLLEGLKIAEETGNKTEIANDQNNIAAIFFKMGKTQESLDYLFRALKTQEQLNEKKGMAFTLNNIGSIYESQGQTKLAIEYYFKGLKLQEQLNNKLGIGSSMNNIATLYMKQNELEKSLEYFGISLKARTEINDKRGIGQCLNNMGNVYKLQNQKVKALEHYEKSIIFFREVDFKQGIASALNNMAALHAEKEEYTEALQKYRESASISELIQDKKALALSYRNMGTILLKQKNMSKAEELTKQALQLADATGAAEVLRDANLTLYQIDSTKGNYKNALSWYRNYIALRDSINNDDTRKAGLKKQFQYEYEKKEEAAQLEQEKKNEIARQEKEKDRIVRNSLIAGVVFMIILAVLILRGYQNKRKANTIILRQKKEVEEAKDIIEKQKLAVEEKQKEILDSIKYAKRIQIALITSENSFAKYLERTKLKT